VFVNTVVLLETANNIGHFNEHMYILLNFQDCHATRTCFKGLRVHHVLDFQ